MNKHNAKEFILLIQAFVEGKTIQYYNKDSSKWNDTSDSVFNEFYQYRIKPEPKPPQYRPWKIEEVPVGALMQWKNVNLPSLILGRDESSIQYTGRTTIRSCSLEDIFNNAEHSTDNGQTWKPCGVLISSEE